MTNPGQETPDNTATRDLRDELKDLNSTLKKTIKSNEKFTLAILALTLIQIIISFTDFVRSTSVSGFTWGSVAWIAILVGFSFWILRDLGAAVRRIEK